MSGPAGLGRVLVINPGSTSTKLSLFAGEQETAAETLRHTAEDLRPFRRIAEQADFRRSAVESFLASSGAQAASLDAVIGRGGLLHPVDSGVYRVTPGMVEDLLAARYGEHASNLGAVLADGIARRASCPAFIADPVVVDELEEQARLSGLPDLPRRSIFHALNQKSAAREACSRRGLSYEAASLIVAHLGGGCSIGAHRDGRVIDVNNALDGEGPFSPERAGTLPAGQLVELALSGRYDAAALKRMITGRGGLVAHCGTNDLTEINRRIAEGDERASLVFEAMCCRISQEVARHGATLRGQVDLVVLTGGMAFDAGLVERISGRIAYLAPVEVIPGEREMLSLARAALDALAGRRPVLEYVP